MYVRFKQCPQNSDEYPVLKNNLRVLYSILKRTIDEAKIEYYENLFNQYKSNIKLTWKKFEKLYANLTANERN